MAEERRGSTVDTEDMAEERRESMADMDTEEDMADMADTEEDMADMAEERREYMADTADTADTEEDTVEIREDGDILRRTLSYLGIVNKVHHQLSRSYKPYVPFSLSLDSSSANVT